MFTAQKLTRPPPDYATETIPQAGQHKRNAHLGYFSACHRLQAAVLNVQKVLLVPHSMHSFPLPVRQRPRQLIISADNRLKYHLLTKAPPFPLPEAAIVPSCHKKEDRPVRSRSLSITARRRALLISLFSSPDFIQSRNRRITPAGRAHNPVSSGSSLTVLLTPEAVIPQGSTTSVSPSHRWPWLVSFLLVSAYRSPSLLLSPDIIH